MTEQSERVIKQSEEAIGEQARIVPSPPSLEKFRFRTSITVRFCEIDGNRHANETSYFVYMEHARMEYLAHLGLFKELLDVNGAASLMAVNFSCNFHAPSHFLQRLVAAARVTRMGRSSVDFVYAIANEASALIASGHQTLAFVEHANTRSQPLPGDARERIARFENLALAPN